MMISEKRFVYFKYKCIECGTMTPQDLRVNDVGTFCKEHATFEMYKKHRGKKE